MKHFGVSTWDEVLAIFEKNGLWGWLATLRVADPGEALYFFSEVEGSGQVGSLYGYWTTKDGKLGLTDTPGSDIFCSADEAMEYAATSTWIGIDDATQDPFPLPGQGLHHTTVARNLAMFDPHRQYLWWRFRPERVDWIGASLDAGGIVLDIYTGGVAGRGTNAVKLARGASTVVGRVDLSRGIWGFLETKGIFSSPWEAAGLGSDVFGLLPPPYGTFFDAGGLIVNFADAGAFQWTP